MIRFNCVLPIALLIIAYAAGATAESVALEAIEITASRLGSSGSPLPVTRLDRHDIDLLQPGSVTDLLRTVPGIDVTQAGGRGGIPFISVRGGEPNFTLVLLDGVPVNDPTNSRGGGFDFNLIDPALIERVEIYKGGTSAIHGGDAMNGVIHVHTRAPTSRSSAAVRVAGGSPNMQAGSLFATARGADTTATLSVARSKRESSASAVDNDAVQINSTLTYTRERLQLRGNVFHAQSDAQAFPEDSGGKRLAVLRDRTTTEGAQSMAALHADYRLMPAVEVRASASWSKHQAEEDSPGIVPGVLAGVPPYRIKSSYERARASLVGDWRIHEQLKLLVGATYDDERGENGGLIDVGFPVPVAFDLSRATTSAFAELSAGLAGIADVNVGLRHDHPDAFAAQTTGRAVIRLTLFSPHWSPYAAWSENFKLPSLFALGNPLVGNPGLRPERSVNIEAGIEFGTAGQMFNARVAGYRSRFEDLVDFDPERFTNVNRDRVTVHGAEVEAHWRPLDRVRLTAGYTYTHNEIEPGGGKLRRRPEHKGSLAAEFALGESWRLATKLLVIGPSVDASIPTGRTSLAGYELLNVSANRRLGQAVTLGLSVRNLLDSRFEEALGMPDPGIGLNAELRYAF